MASAFDDHLVGSGLTMPRRSAVTTLQLNIGLRCNLACLHCHVESGPLRKEQMDRQGCERIVELLDLNPQIDLLDITGGAPELHPEFRWVVEEARRRGRRVMDRCNLTVLHEDGHSDTAEFLAAHEVEIVASLPCYTAENLERQRGRGVFAASIEALQQLNRLGYGTGRLPLDLVYNPVGPSLPPSQAKLENRYRDELREHFGIEFDSLLTITNMPIKRFAYDLTQSGRHEEYMSLLVQSFNSKNLDGLMCRNIISVDHQGRLFDCDFNQALEMQVPGGERTIYDVTDLRVFEGRSIRTADHCFGCTAGAGSSCGGALS
ncbi:MAG: arsenosugar biosynthesis radical SAM protein ArsS [Acidobacteriota bacterium]|nr:arsenosugar biosynthesis radical SAM protein ArsS [Acidobacteriota bacterium]MDH3785981.1 arsenosugar biosynthesis radical SAM protein ArsS [Acidobacteriota bacterium]